MGSATFMYLENSNLKIDDVSSEKLKAGYYLIKLVLDDGKDKVTFNLTLLVFDVP